MYKIYFTLSVASQDWSSVYDFEDWDHSLYFFHNIHLMPTGEKKFCSVQGTDKTHCCKMCGNTRWDQVPELQNLLGGFTWKKIHRGKTSNFLPT